MYIQNPKYKLVYFDAEDGLLYGSITGIPDKENDYSISLGDLFILNLPIRRLIITSNPTYQTQTEASAVDTDPFDFTGLQVSVIYDDGTDEGLEVELSEDEYTLTATMDGEPVSASYRPTETGVVVFAVTYNNCTLDDAFEITIEPQK